MVKLIMSRASTLFLKFAVVIIAILALVVCIFVLPEMAAQDAKAHPDLAYQQYPFLAYSYSMAIIFFIALFFTFKLMIYIDNNKAFSSSSVQALGYIKICSIAISALILLGLITIVILSVGKGEDMTGIIMLALILTFVAGIGATITSILQRQVRKAVELKSENELTV